MKVDGTRQHLIGLYLIYISGLLFAASLLLGIIGYQVTVSPSLQADEVDQYSTDASLYRWANIVLMINVAAAVLGIWVVLKTFLLKDAKDPSQGSWYQDAAQDKDQTHASEPLSSDTGRCEIKAVNGDLEERRAELQWESLPHPCDARPGDIPSLLRELNSASNEKSLQAAERLWDVVTHQGIVWANAVPTFPFLLSGLATPSVDVQVEILNMIHQFSCVAFPGSSEIWTGELRELLLSCRPQMEDLRGSLDEQVAGFAEMILEQMNETSVTDLEQDGIT